MTALLRGFDSVHHNINWVIYKIRWGLLSELSDWLFNNTCTVCILTWLHEWFCLHRCSSYLLLVDNHSSDTKKITQISLQDIHVISTICKRISVKLIPLEYCTQWDQNECLFLYRWEIELINFVSTMCWDSKTANLHLIPYWGNLST